MYITVGYINNDVKSFDRESILVSLNWFITKLGDKIQNRVAQRFIKDLSKININLSGILCYVNELDQKEALKFLSDLQKLKRRIIRVKSKMEEIDFFDNVDLQKMFRTCTSLINKLEISVKKKAFESKPRSTSDTDFLDILAQKSKESLSGTLVKYHEC